MQIYIRYLYLTAQLNVITPRTAFSTKLDKLADYQAASINVQIYINNVLYTITHSVLHASLHTKASWSSHELEESVFKVSFDEESVYALQLVLHSAGTQIYNWEAQKKREHAGSLPLHNLSTRPAVSPGSSQHIHSTEDMQYSTQL